MSLACGAAACVARSAETVPGVGEAWSHTSMHLLDVSPVAFSGADGRAWESPWILAPRAFDELLASWNVTRSSEEVAAVVQVRVASPDGRSTPWLHVGDVGAEGLREEEIESVAGPRLTSCEGVRVDIDVLRTPDETRWHRAQLRVVEVQRDPRAEIRIERLDLCFSTRLASLDDTPRVAVERGDAILLDVPFRSQFEEDPAIASRICSPTALSMSMAYHGVDVPTHAVAARAFDARHDIYGNWPRAIQAAFEAGVPGYLARFSDWADVRRELERGRPLVISLAAKPGQLRGAPYAETAGHLIVLTGFDAAGDVHVNDPAAKDEASGRAVYRRDDLERCWMERGGTAYVLLPPREQRSQGR